MIKLGEICEIGSSTRIFAEEYVDEGIPFFRSKETIELSEGKLSVSEPLFISRERFNEIKASREIPKKGDILLSAVGAYLGIPYWVNVDYDFYFKDGNIIWLRNFDSKVNSKYIYWLIKSNIFQKQFHSKSIGAAQKALTIDSLKQYDISLPTLETQNDIVAILDALDKKILNNNKINAVLESIAKTLYDYWFLQFEFPDENGKPYKSSGGKMVWNNELKREIPYGWTVGNLVENDISTVIKPGVQYFTKKNYLATANVVNDVIFEGDWISFENRESRANMEPKLLSVWFAKMKNSIKHISIPSTGTWFLEKYILSTGFVGIACTETSFPYIHSIINSKSFEIIKDKLSHGATQEAVNNDDLKFVRFVVPTEKILQDYSYKTTPLLEKKFDIIRENQELASLRDFLLPLLMNGQVAFKAEG